MKSNFIDDENKIISMIELSKKDFLMTYSEITEQEYENTKDKILHFVRSKKELNRKLNEKIKKEKLE